MDAEEKRRETHLVVEKEKGSSRVKLSTADIPPGHWGAAAAAAVVDTSVVVTASRATAAANKLVNGIIINLQPKRLGFCSLLNRCASWSDVGDR